MLLFDHVEDPADFRPRRDAELVAADERRLRWRCERLLELAREASIAGVGERRARPRSGGAPEAVDRPARRAGQRLGPKHDRQVPAELARDRIAPQVVAEDGDEAVARRVVVVEPFVDRAAERREDPELVGAPVAAGVEALELGEDPLAGGLADQRRLRPYELLGERRQDEAELPLEPDGSNKPQRVVVEDRFRHGAQLAELEIVASAARVDVLPAIERPRDRVDREIAACEIRLDRPVHRCEVHGTASVQDDAPRRVLLRERKRYAVGLRGERARGTLRLAADDVEVEHGPAEQIVADRAADDPRVLACEHARY